MRKRFRKVAILGRHDDVRVSEPMAVLQAHLTKAGVDVLASDDMTLELPVTRMPEAELARHADLLIAVGGDGTMLYAAHLAIGLDVPLLGINRGRLGFLADVTPDEMLDSVDHVLAGNFSTDSRLLLEAKLMRPDGDDVAALALNDVVLQRRETGRMVDFETRIADNYVNAHAGDGLVVATPTGSTAYALSCGGPIIEPHLDALVVVPVAPHTLTDRPLVVGADKPITVRMLQRDDSKGEITVDGHPLGEIRPQDKLLIAAATSRVTLLHPPGYDFYSILRSKLYWGRDVRRRDSAAGSG